MKMETSDRVSYWSFAVALQLYFVLIFGTYYGVDDYLTTQREAESVVGGTTDPLWAFNLPGMSPNYLRGDDWVLLFKCGTYQPKLMIDQVTDGVNHLHVYRSPCWSI